MYSDLNETISNSVFLFLGYAKGSTLIIFFGNQMLKYMDLFKL